MFPHVFNSDNPKQIISGGHLLKEKYEKSGSIFDLCRMIWVCTEGYQLVTATQETFNSHNRDEFHKVILLVLLNTGTVMSDPFGPVLCYWPTSGR